MDRIYRPTIKVDTITPEGFFAIYDELAWTEILNPPHDGEDLVVISKARRLVNLGKVTGHRTVYGGRSFFVTTANMPPGGCLQLRLHSEVNK